MTKILFRHSLDSGISIHTPAKGVTPYFSPYKNVSRISIHTPAKGVTKNLFQGTVYTDYFNPHSREGSDGIMSIHLLQYSHFNPHSREGSDEILQGSNNGDVISIHTPAKGVTQLAKFSGISSKFQSTLPRREWRKSKSSARSEVLFQSTLPRREWLDCTAAPQVGGYFNPHSREGSDGVREGDFAQQLIFQSTLPRREWQQFCPI